MIYDAIVIGSGVVGNAVARELTPHVTGTVALWSPASGIVNPFLYTIALAENSRANGAQFFFDREVSGAKIGK